MIVRSHDEDILEAGRSIRPALPSLYPSDTWPTVDAELASALNEADPLLAVPRVRAVLEARPETAGWWLAFQVRGLPPELEDVTRGAWTPVGGAGEVVQAPRFACPHGDYVWYRRSAARAIPICRTHQVRLAPSPVLGS
jgi:hypothetical protein